MEKFSSTIFKVIIIAVIVVVAIFTVRFFAGDEDTWLCVDGEWVKHGVPSAPKPETGCGEERKVIINNFNECVKAGFSVMESYPRKCQNKDGKTFIEDIGNELGKADLIRISSPRPNQVVSSPLVIEGEARGYWFFEGDFPVKLLDSEYYQITSGVAKAQSEWMTEDFVKFKAELNFTLPAKDSGMIILEKDNPSGMIENMDELRVPVKFK